MFTFATIALLLALALIVARALAGPTIFDRTLAANLAGTATILIVAVVGFLTDRPEFLDISILYALLNIIATLAVLRFFRGRADARAADQAGK